MMTRGERIAQLAGAVASVGAGVAGVVFATGGWHSFALLWTSAATLHLLELLYLWWKVWRYWRRP